MQDDIPQQYDRSYVRESRQGGTATLNRPSYAAGYGSIPQQNQPYTQSYAAFNDPQGNLRIPVYSNNSAQDVPYQTNTGVGGQRNPKTSREIIIDGQVHDIAPSRATELENPRHVRVTGNIQSTPGYFRLISPARDFRYMVAGIIGSFLDFKELLGINVRPKIEFNGAIPNIGFESVSDVIKRRFNTVDEFAKIVHNNLEVDGTIAPDTYQQLVSANQDVYDKAIKEIKRTPNADLFKKDGLADDMLKDWAGVGIHPTDANASFDAKLKQHNTKDGFKKNTKALIQGETFDAALGTIMLGATTAYAWRVLNDIVETYAETIAYETNQDPKDVGWRDVFKSDNKIVKQTRDNYVAKNTFRYANDLGFFSRQLGKVLPAMIPGTEWIQRVKFGEIMLGVKAMSLLGETQRPTTSLFDDIISMIDNKLNPQKGLGEPIKASDLLDLFQKYESKNNPENMFSDATRHEKEDDAEWRMSNAVFSRMADLMNSTYKYKHGFDKELEPEDRFTRDVLTSERYFTLPKYLYLLGHDLIDPTQPEKTLAYAEVANHYGIQAVKPLQRLLEYEGVPLAEALKRYPVDLEVTLGSKCPNELTAISQFARQVDQADIEEAIAHSPDLQHEYQQILRDKAVKEALKNGEPNPAVPQAAFMQDSQLRIPVPEDVLDYPIETNQTLRQDGTPKVSFFNPRTESFQHSNENLNARPDTRVTDQSDPELVLSQSKERQT